GVIIDNNPNTVIGGTSPGAGNVISGNTGAAGVLITGPNATGNQVLGNFIGTNVTGTAAVANTQDGVRIEAGANNNTIGGTTAAARNVISGNLAAGIQITGTSGNVVQGNYLGINAAGTAALANVVGVMISQAASNVIGGSIPGAGNVISGNTNAGVYVTGASAANNLIAGNLIGTNAAGTAALPNVFGVDLDTAGHDNLIGGVTAGARNIISGNDRAGVYIAGSGANNAVQGNWIGLNSTGTAGLSNDNGVIISGSPSTTIGGTAAGAGNVISGNVTGI